MLGKETLNSKSIEKLNPRASIILDESDDDEKMEGLSEKLLKKESDTRKQILDIDQYPYCCIGLINGQLEGR